MDSYNQIVNRNIGILTHSQQDVLKKAKIAIAGCGADGGSPALSLARLGIKSFHLADPDFFDVSNINRQEGAYLGTVSRNKAGIIGDLILNIHSDANILTFENGVDENNISSFLEGVDIVLEEIDYRAPIYSMMVHRAARERGIPVFTAVSVAWNAFLFYFDPNGMTYEEYTGIDKEVNSNFNSTDINIKAFAPVLPAYLPSQLIEDVINEKIEIPAVDPAIKMAAAMISSFVIFHLTGSKEIKAVPYYYEAGDLLVKEPKLASHI